jgi:hypothetical protein
VARLKFKVSARVRSGPVAGTTYIAYTDASGTVLADIAATSGGSSLPGSAFTLDALGKATIWGPPDGTSNLYVRAVGDTSLGVQEIEADADARLDVLDVSAGLATLTPRTAPAAPASGALVYVDSADSKVKAVKAGGDIIVVG